jgi:hypothetical protein
MAEKQMAFFGLRWTLQYVLIHVRIGGVAHLQVSAGQLEPPRAPRGQLNELDGDGFRVGNPVHVAVIEGSIKKPRLVQIPLAGPGKAKRAMPAEFSIALLDCTFLIRVVLVRIGMGASARRFSRSQQVLHAQALSARPRGYFSSRPDLRQLHANARAR